MRRTVNVEFNPCPRRPMTTPEKIWMRSLSPSMTLVWTRTLSPTPKSEVPFRYCSDSILSNNAWFINSLSLRLLLQQIGPARLRPQGRLFAAPLLNFRMIAGQQHRRDLQPPELRRPRVMRILQQPLAKRFVQRALVVPQRSRQQPRHGVDDHHGR